jgi:WD40 repeat protein
MLDALFTVHRQSRSELLLTLRRNPELAEDATRKVLHGLLVLTRSSTFIRYAVHRYIRCVRSAQTFLRRLCARNRAMRQRGLQEWLRHEGIANENDSSSIAGMDVRKRVLDETFRVQRKKHITLWRMWFKSQKHQLQQLLNAKEELAQVSQRNNASLITIKMVQDRVTFLVGKCEASARSEPVFRGMEIDVAALHQRVAVCLKEEASSRVSFAMVKLGIQAEDPLFVSRVAQRYEELVEAEHDAAKQRRLAAKDKRSRSRMTLGVTPIRTPSRRSVDISVNTTRSRPRSSASSVETSSTTVPISSHGGLLYGSLPNVTNDMTAGREGGISTPTLLPQESPKSMSFFHAVEPRATSPRRPQSARKLKFVNELEQTLQPLPDEQKKQQTAALEFLASRTNAALSSGEPSQLSLPTHRLSHSFTTTPNLLLGCSGSILTPRSPLPVPASRSPTNSSGGGDPSSSIPTFAMRPSPDRAPPSDPQMMKLLQLGSSYVGDYTLSAAEDAQRAQLFRQSFVQGQQAWSTPRKRAKGGGSAALAVDAARRHTVQPAAVAGAPRPPPNATATKQQQQRRSSPSPLRKLKVLSPNKRQQEILAEVEAALTSPKSPPSLSPHRACATLELVKSTHATADPSSQPPIGLPPPPLDHHNHRMPHSRPTLSSPLHGRTSRPHDNTKSPLRNHNNKNHHNKMRGGSASVVRLKEPPIILDPPEGWLAFEGGATMMSLEALRPPLLTLSSSPEQQQGDCNGPFSGSSGGGAGANGVSSTAAAAAASSTNNGFPASSLPPTAAAAAAAPLQSSSIPSDVVAFTCGSVTLLKDSNEIFVNGVPVKQLRDQQQPLAGNGGVGGTGGGGGGSPPSRSGGGGGVRRRSMLTMQGTKEITVLNRMGPLSRQVTSLVVVPRNKKNEDLRTMNIEDSTNNAFVSHPNDSGEGGDLNNYEEAEDDDSVGGFYVAVGTSDGMLRMYTAVSTMQDSNALNSVFSECVSVTRQAVHLLCAVEHQFVCAASEDDSFTVFRRRSTEPHGARTNAKWSSHLLIKTNVPITAIAAIRAATTTTVEQSAPPVVVNGNQSTKKGGSTSSSSWLFAVATFDSVVSLWDLEAKHVAVRLEGHSQGINHVVGLSTGAVMTASRDATVKVWSLSAKSGAVDGGAPSIDASSRRLHHAPAPPRRGSMLSHRPAPPQAPINQLPSPLLYSCTSASYRGHTSSVVRALEHRSSVVSISLDNTIRIWDPRTLDTTCVITKVAGHLFHSLISVPHLSYFVFAQMDGVAQVFSSETGKCISKKALPSPIVATQALERHHVAFFCADGTVTICSAERGLETIVDQQPVHGVRGAVLSHLWLPQQQVLVTGGEDRLVLVLAVPPLKGGLKSERRSVVEL